MVLKCHFFPDSFRLLIKTDPADIITMPATISQVGPDASATLAPAQKYRKPTGSNISPAGRSFFRFCTSTIMSVAKNMLKI